MPPLARSWLAALALGGAALAQTPATSPPPAALPPGHPSSAEPPQQALAAEALPAAPAWELGFTLYAYHVPDDHDYLQPTLLADRGWLHLEARWNYEALDTGSLWFGCNLEFGDELWLEITPMAGVVVGETTGMAPGFRGTLGYGEFELYSESEYVVDTGDASDSFFYSWSELAWSPTDWLRVGAVLQRTRVYETDREVQRGLLLGVALARFDVTAYVFNPDDSELTVVLGVGVGF